MLGYLLLCTECEGEFLRDDARWLSERGEDYRDSVTYMICPYCGSEEIEDAPEKCRVCKDALPHKGLDECLDCFFAEVGEVEGRKELGMEVRT